MIYYKTPEEIELIRENSLLISRTLAELAKIIEPGVTPLELDKKAEKFIINNDAKPAFKGYNGFPNTLCISVNEAVVHGIPDNRKLVEGDIVSIDCGVFKNGFYGDSAYTFAVGILKDSVKQLLLVTKDSLIKAFKKISVDSRVGDIGYTIQSYVESYGYGIVKELVGHGIGKSLHEDPQIPNYGKKSTGPSLKKGMVIAIEPMVSLGSPDVIQGKDGWTIYTKDKSPAAHFEHTVAITDDGVLDVLSTFDFIEEALDIKK